MLERENVSSRRRCMEQKSSNRIIQWESSVSQITCCGGRRVYNVISSVLPADTQDPQISCPQDITSPTDANKAFATVSWSVPSPTDNSGKLPGLTVLPEDITSSPHQFGVGKTLITYTATDPAGMQASCTFSVYVLGMYSDKEKLFYELLPDN